MRLVTYQDQDQPRLGALVQRWVIDLEKACRVTGDCSANPNLREMHKFLASPERHAAVRRAVDFFTGRLQTHQGRTASNGILRPLGEVELLTPVLRPRKILCLGSNYPPQPAALGEEKPPYPLLFERSADSLLAPGKAIELPGEAQEVVPEGELAVVIGRPGRHIRREQAREHIGGYTIANDVTALDLQRRASQWTTGKLADAFLPLGMVLVTPDEIPDPQDLTLSTWINDRLYQQGSTVAMHYAIDELIAYVSTRITLYPGDLLLTGSPKYRGEEPLPQVYLQAGDIVRVEIQELGVLENPVEQERA